MNGEQLKNIIEAALMAADTPLAISQLQALFEEDADRPDKDAIRQALEELALDYQNHGIELREVASGFRFQVRSDYAPWVNRLQEEKPQRYSRALLETLAIHRLPAARYARRNRGYTRCQHQFQHHPYPAGAGMDQGGRAPRRAGQTGTAGHHPAVPGLL